MNERMLDLLYRSFDDELTEAERQELNSALSASPDLQEEKKQLLELRGMVGESSVSAFKPFFSARVMQRVKELQGGPEEFLHALTWSFKRLAVAGAMAAVLLIAVNVASDGRLSLDSLLAMPQLEITDTWQLDDLTEENLQ